MTHDAAPPLADLMPWSVAPPKLGRGWPAATDPGVLKARWEALLRAEGAEREALFEPTRARTLRSAVPQLPGRHPDTDRLTHATGPCPAPVRVLHSPYDERWLLPDHRLIDAARPELWRVADAHQTFLLETPDGLLPTPHLPLLRPSRVRPLYRRPHGQEPNLAPGLLDHLAAHLGETPSPEDVLAWILATATPDLRVPLTKDPTLWTKGTEKGHRLLWLHRRTTPRPKLPGGRRPYVRAPLPPRPTHFHYTPEEETLHLNEGRVSPVPQQAWNFHHGELRVLEEWLRARTTAPEPEKGKLEQITTTAWPQTWTTELLELITVLTLLAEEGARMEAGHSIGDLAEAGILPPPSTSRTPASVLDHQEEGPEGQLALI